MQRVVKLVQRTVGGVLAGQAPHSAIRELLAKVPPPATRLEELVLHGFVFETAVGGLGATRGSARHAARRAVRKLLPRTSALRRKQAAQLDRVARAIVKGHAAPLDIRALARSEAMHETTLRRLFAVQFGVSPRVFCTRVRVCRAIHLFREETRDVMAVARLVGYRSDKNFYRAVRDVTGLTPAELRAARWSCRWPVCSQIDTRKPGSPRACQAQRFWDGGRTSPPRASATVQSGDAEVPGNAYRPFTS